MSRQIEFVGLDIPVASHPLTRTNIAALHSAHSALRDVDGLHADKALDELCKLLFAKMWDELKHADKPLFSQIGKSDHEIVDSVTQVYVEAREHAFATSQALEAGGAFSEPVQLSAGALRRVVSALSPLSLLSSQADIKGAAFQQVLSAAIRNGMGQYFTPEPVVDTVVQMIAPRPGERVLDPFCGSGRFLSTSNRLFGNNQCTLELHGIEKSDRMVRIALTEILIDGINAITFHRGDSLTADLAKRGDFDVVLTNPPFGSLLQSTEHLAEEFELARLFDSVPLEVLGIELCAKALREGGRAGIVLPESILNTRQMQSVRDYVLRHFDVISVLSLPPQTFAPFEGVGKASVLLMLKRAQPKNGHLVFAAAPENIGYDNTGRKTFKNDLPEVVAAFKAFMHGESVTGKRLAVVEQSSLVGNFSYSALLASRREDAETVPLKGICHTLMCGTTPPKTRYSDEGCRILKVGDLSGEGIDWDPRDRAFVPPQYLKNRRKKIEVGDILLTAAAHHPKYIGQKVDIVDRIPGEYASKDVGFVAELLLIRVDPAICDPYMLLMWLRSLEGYNALQSCVVGQTGHLYPEQAEKIRIPKVILEPTKDMRRAMAVLKRSLKCRHFFKRLRAEAECLFERALQS